MFQKYRYFQALSGDVTWVVSDHTGGGGELSVRAGQQVEVVDLPSSQPDYAMVRLATSSLALEVTPRQEMQDIGLVPVQCLKPQPARAHNKSVTDPDPGKIKIS